MKYTITLMTDHFQFFLEDSQTHTDTGDIWSDAELAQRIVCRPGFVAIPTARFGGQTRIIIEVSDAPPAQPPDSCADLVHGSLTVHSGQIAVSAPEIPPRDAILLDVAPGAYKLLVCSAGLDTVEDELAPEGRDYYHVFLWPE